MKEALLAALREHGQEHLVAFWGELDEGQRSRLQTQIEHIDLALVSSLFRGGEKAPDWNELAARARPPAAVRLSEMRPNQLTAIRDRGQCALREGRVGMILVAGGQGSRLGFDHPKGMLPIGPISGRTLFQVLLDRLRSISVCFETSVPLYLMTSPATHAETVRYFEENAYCGLPPEDVKFFCQGTMPVLDAQQGRLLLSSKDCLALGPDGHGGMLSAFKQSGCLEDAGRRKIDLLFYGQVDNPLLQVCDPTLLGCHLESKSEMTTQVVRKSDPTEKLGNVVRVDERTRIIEYSDLPPSLASQTDGQGELLLWAGNVAVHVFDRSFLARMAEQAEALPFHRALKKASFVNELGACVQPTEPNAIKFEKFIFDLLPEARIATVVESSKDEAFSPVKNAAGAASDTASTAQLAMIRRDVRLLEAAGIKVVQAVDVEVNPLWALNADDVRSKLQPETTVSAPTYFA